MRLPFCPVGVTTRTPDAPEGVVGRLVPAASPAPVPVLGVETFAAVVDVRFVAEPDGVVLRSLAPASPPPPVLDADDEAVCLGETDVLDEAAALLAFHWGWYLVSFWRLPGLRKVNSGVYM